MGWRPNKRTHTGGGGDRVSGAGRWYWVYPNIFGCLDRRPPSPYRVRRAGPSADLGFWQAPKNSARSTYPKSGQGGPKIYIMYLKNPSRYNRSFCKTESPIVSRVSNASSSSDFSEKSAPPLPGATMSVPKLGQLGGRQQACQVPRREAPPDARGCYRGHGKACRVTLGGRRPCPDVSGGGEVQLSLCGINI